MIGITDDFIKARLKDIGAKVSVEQLKYLGLYDFIYDLILEVLNYEDVTGVQK